MTAVTVGTMWYSMGRAIAGFDRAVADRAGEPFDGQALVPGSGAGDSPAWTQDGPGTWVVGTKPGNGTLSLEQGDDAEPTFAVTPLPARFGNSYSLAFSVRSTAQRSGVVLAASDNENRLELRDDPSLERWSFTEVVGGKRTTRAVQESVTFEPGDRVSVRFDPPEVHVEVNGWAVASVPLARPDGRIWVGFYGYDAGFAVSDVALGGL
ncbi:MAG: hypothetical protein R2754_03250 [Microthrixaceae bacterium]